MTSLSRHSTGSRFIGRVTATLHGHHRSASAEYVYRSVMVGIGTESAGGTDEAGLAFARSSVHGSAIRTGLRSIGGGHLNERPATLLKLVREHHGKLAPSLVEYGAVETPFSFPSRGHVRYFQILEHDCPKTFGYRTRDAVLPVAADTRNLASQPSHASFLPSTTVRSALAPRELSLGPPYLSFDRRKVRKLECLTVRQGQRLSNPPVYSDCWIIVRWRFMLNCAGKADMPAKHVGHNRCCLDFAVHRASATVFHPTYFWQPDHAPALADLPNGYICPLIAEAIVQPFFTRRGEALAAREEIIKCPVQVSQGLDQATRWRCLNPIHFRAKNGNFAALADEVQAPARVGSILPPEGSPLLQREIIDEPRHPRELAHKLCLLGRRVEPEFEGAVHELSIADAKGTVQ